MKDFLFLHISSLPYFRGFLRAVESSFYQDLTLPAPILDLGCGDGNFAELTFDCPIDVGLDPWHGPIHEAKQYWKYRLLVEANAGTMPLPDNWFASVFSNSVLEHIPNVEQVLAETRRVLQPGGLFVFCVPNHNFLPTLSIGKALDKVGLRSLGNLYRAFFNRISRHYHCDAPPVWQARLEQNGFVLEDWWHYFSPQALHVLEWGHYWGLPSLILHTLFRRWIVVPTRWNLYFIERYLRKFVKEPKHPEGVYTFYIARKK
ncbi:MAG: class I SAM-dependent methyltransferase [Chloroflexota bacterium]